MWIEDGVVRYVGEIGDVAAAYRAGSVHAATSAA
jgi:hypothetical protein